MNRLKLLENELGIEVVRELIGVFLSSTPQQLHEMHRHLSQDEKDEVKKIAHNLRTSCATVGAEEMEGLCLKLEQSKPSDKNFPALYEALHQAFEAFRPTMEERLVNFP